MALLCSLRENRLHQQCGRAARKEEAARILQCAKCREAAAATEWKRTMFSQSRDGVHGNASEGGCSQPLQQCQQG